MVVAMDDVGRRNGVEQQSRDPRLQIEGPVERELRLSALAGRQGRAIGHEQMLRMGFSYEAIRYRIRAGRLQRWHPKVYIVGPGPPNQRGRWFAGLLANLPHPNLSYLSAGAHEGVVAEGVGMHLTTTNRGGRNLRGVTVHRVRHLHPADTKKIDDLPLTTLPRTLLDLAEILPHHRLEKVFEAVDRRQVLDFAAIRACVARNPGRRGIKPLLALVESYVPTPGAEEGIEREFGLLLHEEGLPLPIRQVQIDGKTVDCFWPADNFVVELDSKGFHKEWAARERDMVRDADLLRLGIATLRVTRRRMREERPQLVADIRLHTRASAALR